jgi:4-hydroxybenzoate polyprenyltransferase
MLDSPPVRHVRTRVESSARRSSPIETARQLFQLARPAGAWIPSLLPLLGMGWAHWDRALPAWRLDAIVWLALAWAFLHAGTLWLNAARDRDDGEVLFGRAVPVPRHAARYAAAALGLAILLAWGAGWMSALITGACAALAVLYSHPATAWKAHPVLGPAVNVVGYGLLSPLAGFVVIGGPPTPRTAIIAGLLGITALGWTFAAQAFQRDEDQARGDRTLVATHGAATTLNAARLCFAVAGLGVLGMAAIGWLPRAVLIATPALLAMDVYLKLWARQPDGGSEAWARRLAWLALLFGLLCVTGAVGSYAVDSFMGRPVAGLGTRAGHPGDRLILPASHQTALDRRDRAETGHAYRPR